VVIVNLAILIQFTEYNVGTFLTCFGSIGMFFMSFWLLSISPRFGNTLGVYDELYTEVNVGLCMLFVTLAYPVLIKGMERVNTVPKRPGEAKI